MLGNSSGLCAEGAETGGGHRLSPGGSRKPSQVWKQERDGRRAEATKISVAQHGGRTQGRGTEARRRRRRLRESPGRDEEDPRWADGPTGIRASLS